ncbi:MAG: 2-hydroxyacid dehydrogenase [Bradyrhizobium sp.]|nr:MAG: 2-hydroxyacid dehydrogenase [Bradyrhizobium sp.]
MAPFEALMLVPGMAEVVEPLGKRLILHRLWEAPDPEAMLREVGPRVRAIVSTWHPPRVDAALMSRLPKLEIVVSFGVGYDHIDAAWAGAHGITVTHTPGVLDDDVADLAMALTLAATRRLPQAERYLREGRWADAPFPLAASLGGRTMGILGLGRIGRQIAKRAEAFGLTIVYHNRRRRDDAPYAYRATPVALAQACDILVVAAPGGEGTRRIVNASVLAALGPDGVLINVARGSLVDEAALIAALRERKILAAGLDVYENEPNVPEALLALDNVVALPHVGSGTRRTRKAMADLLVGNLLSWVEGKGPLTPTPETPWPRPQN